MNWSKPCLASLLSLTATWGGWAFASAAPEAEVHLLVCGATTNQLLHRLDLDANDAKVQHLFFVETPGLDLLDAGLILRFTEKASDQSVEFDVKLRPIEPGTLDPGWQDTSGFKCEVDATPASEVTACRLRHVPNQTTWRRVRDCQAPFSTALSTPQRQLIAETHGELPDDGELSLLGPMTSKRWKISVGDDEVTLEVWPLQHDLIELSTRVDADDVEGGHATLAAVADQAGAHACPEQGSKTRRALTYLVANAP